MTILSEGRPKRVGSLFLQTLNGFERQDSDFLENDKSSEDSGALLFDADGDGDNDLYIVSGGYEFASESDELQDRIYLNDGRGQFGKTDETVLPKLNSSGSKAYNGILTTMEIKIFWFWEGKFPVTTPPPASSYILENSSDKDKVKFDIFTAIQPPEFENLGMATSAIITDFNNDKSVRYYSVRRMDAH